MLEHVPAALKACPQWLVYRKEWNEARQKWDKMPYSVHSGRKCDVTAVSSWCDFHQACYAVAHYGSSHGLAGCGFVLGYNSDCVGVDFDDVFYTDGRVASQLNLAMAERFGSYTELSPSRTGLHVLTAGQFAGGRRANGVEIYGQGRFFTVTGEPYGAPREFARRQTEIDALVSEIDTQRQATAPRPLDYTIVETMDDRAVYDMARNADNGTKFLDLWEGRWQQHYGSQSEADYALINMLGFYSDAPTQIQRLFQLSALGQRDKARRLDYVVGMIARSQDRKPPVVAIPLLQQQPSAPIAASPTVDDDDAEETAARADDAFQAPPGFVRDLADWLYMQSEYPMKELALIGAIGLLAGIVGRQYQFKGQGLNLYFMLLAHTGAGKDALSNGISKIFDAVAAPVPVHSATPGVADLGFPAAKEFKGPSQLTGAGLLRSFANTSTLSMVSVLPEFSQTITSMAHPNANQGLRDFQRALLEFYTKSAAGASYDGAKNSDKTKDIAAISSPAFTMLCEGTPQRFYNALTPEMVTDGLLSRFIVVERETVDLHANKDVDTYREVPPHIKASIAFICQHVLQLRTNGDVRIQVEIEPDAAEYSEQLRLNYRKRGIADAAEVERALWMRAHQNLTRMAAIAAVGVNPYHPVVTREHIAWANRIIYRQVTLIVGKFKRGDVGQFENKDAEQYQTVLELLDKWITFTPSKPYFVTAKAAGLMPYAFVQERTHRLSVFRQDKRGVTAALRVTLEALEKTGAISRARMQGSEGVYYRVHL